MGKDQGTSAAEVRRLMDAVAYDARVLKGKLEKLAAAASMEQCQRTINAAEAAAEGETFDAAANNRFILGWSMLGLMAAQSYGLAALAGALEAAAKEAKDAAPWDLHVLTDAEVEAVIKATGMEVPWLK